MRGDAGERELDHAPERIFAGAVPPLPGLIGDLGDREPEPAHHAAQEQLLVFEPVDGVDDGAIHQQEVGAARLHLHVAERAQHAIIKSRRRPLEARHRDDRPRAARPQS